MAIGGEERRGELAPRLWPRTLHGYLARSRGEPIVQWVGENVGSTASARTPPPGAMEFQECRRDTAGRRT